MNSIRLATGNPRKTKSRSLSQDIRSSIQALHDEVEQTPLAQAIILEQIRLPEYRRLIEQSYLLHTYVEERLSAYPLISNFFTPEMRRIEALKRDLFNLGGSLFPSPTQAVVHFIQRFERSERLNPLALLGAIYVFEGSRMGSMILLPKLSYALGLKAQMGVGLDYHCEGIEETPQRFRQFKQRLDHFIVNPADQRVVVNGAVQCMQGLVELYKDISVDEEGRIS